MYKIVQDRKDVQKSQRLEGQRFTQLAKDFLWVSDPKRYYAIFPPDYDDGLDSQQISSEELSSIEDFVSQLEQGETITAEQLSGFTEWM